MRVRYGWHAQQFGDLSLPAVAGPWPVAVLLHGGFWRAGFGLDLMDPLAADLVRLGFAVWNLEYRTGRQGAWPVLLDDVGAGVDALAEVEAPLDLARVVCIGHSAGGHLALWACTRKGAVVRPAAAVSLAGVSDLVAGAHADLGHGAVQAFIGATPDQEPERYALASPLARLPLGVPQLLVHGRADDRVPVEQSATYAAAAAGAGDPVELIELPGVDHFEVIDPTAQAWREVVRWLALLRPPAS